MFARLQAELVFSSQMDTDSHSYDSIAAVRRELETLEALALATEREAQELASPTRRLVISTKPEIRKGCTWDVHFAIDTALLKEEGISKLYVLNAPKSKAERAPVLALTVRSKLIKPTLELAFTKVAKIVSERDYLTPNSAGVVVLKARPPRPSLAPFGSPLTSLPASLTSLRHRVLSRIPRITCSFGSPFLNLPSSPTPLPSAPPHSNPRAIALYGGLISILDAIHGASSRSVPQARRRNDSRGAPQNR